MVDHTGYDVTYCYANSNVLKNKLEIKDSGTLLIAEREYSSLRLYELQTHPIKGSFDLQHLQKIHNYMFQDVYEWAGKLRTVEIAKGNMFCSCNYITSYSEQIFRALQKDKYLIGMPKGKVIEKVAYYLGEINAMHPFREGNGRTQREFISSLAKLNGYELNFDKVNEKQMIEASIKAFDCVYEPMQNLIQAIIAPMTKVEHQEFVNYMTNDNSVLKREFTRLENQLER